MATAPKLELVHLSPTADSSLRWPDGSLKGMKTFTWRSGEVLSPMYNATWVAGKLTAENFFQGETVRGEGGIHAIWPPRGLDDAGMDEYLGYVPRKSQFMALVAGWGRCVMGDVGWRAEHARIRIVMTAPRVAGLKFREWCKEHGITWGVL